MIHYHYFHCKPHNFLFSMSVTFLFATNFYKRAEPGLFSVYFHSFHKSITNTAPISTK